MESIDEIPRKVNVYDIRMNLIYSETTNTEFKTRLQQKEIITID